MSRKVMGGPADLYSRNDSTPVAKVGSVIVDQETGNTLRYVQKVDAVANVSGDIAYFADNCTTTTGLTIVTADISNSLTAVPNCPAGVFTCAVTQNYYTYVLTGGTALINTDSGGDIAAGDRINGKAAADGGVAEHIATGSTATYGDFAFALAADNHTPTPDNVLCEVCLLDANIAGAAPADVRSRNDATAMFTPGAIYYDVATGKGYRYVQVTDAVAPVAGEAAYWSDDDLPTQWAADTAKAVGSKVVPLACGNPVKVYTAIRNDGDTKTHATTEPTWDDFRDVVDDMVTWRYTGCFKLTKVTADYSENAGDTLNAVAGIFTYAATQNYFTFIQVSGICSIDTVGGGATFHTGGAAAIGKAADCGGDNINAVAGGTAPTQKVIGFAAAESGTAGLCVLTLARGGRVAQAAPEDVEYRNDQIPVFKPGNTYRDNLGRTYKYVQVVESVAPIKGCCAYWSDHCTATTGLVYATADYSEVLGDSINAVAGIWTYAATANYYTFIQTGGLCDYVHTDGGGNINAAGAAAKGTAVDVGAASDGVALDNLAGTSPTNRTVGWSTAAEAASTVTLMLTLDT